MLSLAIIAIILVLATRFYFIATESSKINQVYTYVGELKQGLYNLNATTGQNATSATELATGNYISQQTANLANGGNNPWGGSFTFAAGPPATLTMSLIPKSSCSKICSQYPTATGCTCTGNACTCGSDSNTLTIPLQ